MLPKTMPLPGGRGWRMSPVRAPEWSPCPFTSTLRPIVRSGKHRAGATRGAAPAAAGAAVSAGAAAALTAVPALGVRVRRGGVRCEVWEGAPGGLSYTVLVGATL